MWIDGIQEKENGGLELPVVTKQTCGPTTSSLIAHIHMGTTIGRQDDSNDIQVPSKDKTGPEKPAQWKEEDPDHQHVWPASLQIPCWYSEMVIAGHGSCQCEDSEASQNVWSFHPRSNTQETIYQPERGRQLSGKCQSYCTNEIHSIREYNGIQK